MRHTVERDETDQGLSRYDDKSPVERSAELAAVSAESLGGPTREATDEERRAAIALARQACGWREPSRSAELAQRCDRCGALPTQWCRGSRGFHAKPGRLCVGRGEVPLPRDGRSR